MVCIVSGVQKIIGIMLVVFSCSASLLINFSFAESNFTSVFNAWSSGKSDKMNLNVNSISLDSYYTI